eukprot:300113_1
MNIQCFCYLASYMNVDGITVSDNAIEIIFWISAMANMLLLIHVVQTWLQRRHGLEQIGPSFLMIPLANFIAVFVGVNIDNTNSDVLWLWFSSAFILFFILFPITFYKIIVDSNSDDRRRNNLLIWCAAPCAVGLAFESLNTTDVSNTFPLIMYWSSIFMALIIFNLIFQKFIARSKFDSSYYSFGFSLCLVAIAALKIFHINKSVHHKLFYEIIAYLFVSVACLAVAVNVLHFIFALCQQRIFRPILPKWSVLSFMRLTHEAFRGWIYHMDILLSDTDNHTINFSKIISEWNVMSIVETQHAKHEDDVIFKEANTLFPGFTDGADEQHKKLEIMMQKITESLNEINDKIDVDTKEIIDDIKNFLIILKEHLLFEEANIQPILRKYIPIELQKRIIQKIWNCTHDSEWKILIPWIVRNQRKLPQRILFLKTLLWAMPYRCQMIGLIVYRGCSDIVWADIAQELPEIIPRGITGWRRQY